MPLTAAQVTMLTDWVNAGGNLIAMRPDKQLAGLLGLTDAGGDARRTATCRSTPRRRPGAGIVGQTIQFHGTADRYTLNGATDVATLYSRRDDGDRQPGGDAAQRRRQRRPGGGVHLRPRALGRLHAPGQPGLGRPGARRHRADPLRRPVLRRQPATAARLGRPRTRSRSRRPTSSSGCWRT